MTLLVQWISAHGVTILSAVFTGVAASLLSPWMRYLVETKIEKRHRRQQIMEEELKALYEPLVKIMERYLDPYSEDYGGMDEVLKLTYKSRRYASRDLITLVTSATAQHNLRGGYEYDEDGQLARFVYHRFEYLRKHCGYSRDMKNISISKTLRSLKFYYQLITLKIYLWKHQTETITTPIPPRDPEATVSAPQSPGESPVLHPKTSGDDADSGDASTHGP